MKKYLSKITKLIMMLSLVWLLPFCTFAQVTATEDFENEATANATTPHTFSESGISFLSTLTFQKFATGFGYNASTSYTQVSGNTVTKTITIQTASTSFKINSFAAYVATATNGNGATNGPISFVGTLVGGATVSATVNVASTGTVPAGQTREANQMVNGLNFVGTPLDGIYLTSLSVSTSATVLYAQLDHISFTTQAVVSNQFSISDVTQNEGNSGTSNFVFTVTRSNNTAASSVQVQSSNGTATSGSDYTAFPLTTVNFTAGGALTQTVNVVVNGDVTVEPNETFTMTLSNPIGGVLLDPTGTGTIVDDDAINEPFDDEVHLSSVFSQSGNAFQTTDKLIVRNAGNFGQGGSSGYSAPTEPYISGKQGSFQITTPGKSFNVISVDLWSATVSGSAPNWTYTATNCNITFTGTKADGTGTVTHTAAITPSGTNVHSPVIFAGSPLANIQLSAISFSTPTGITYLQIDNFKYGTATLSNTQLSINDVSVIEGTGAGTTTATFTVTRTNNTTAFSVDVASANGTASAGTDYTAFPATTLNFTIGGALTQTVNVTIAKDATIEQNETFFMNLTNATNGTVYLKQTGIGTILNDDSVIETFEDETNNATVFNESGVSFTSSGGYRVRQATTFGSGSSNFYLSSLNNAVGNQGTFSITTANKAFKLNGLDAWVGTSETSHSSGSVTFTGTLFGGGTVITTRTITATAATGAGWQQNVTFTGTPLDNVLLTAIQVTTAGALTEADIDNFNFTVINTLPIIEVTDASNNAITNNGAASAANNTAFGATCVTGGTVSKTYTIKNTGVAANLTLTGNPLAVVGGTDASQFSVSTQPTTPVAAAGSVTFTVVFNPTSAGTKNATITLNSNDATDNPYVINITGISNADPTITLGTVPSICAGATSFTIPFTATTATPTTYTISGTGFTTVTDAILPATLITVVLSAPAVFGTNPTYNLTVKNANGCISAIAAGTITVNASTLPTTTQTVTQSVINNSISASGCATLVNVLPIGGAPVTGNVTAKVWVETTQPVQFVKRHYEINPATNATNATAKVTLYFSDAEFNAFNTQTTPPALLLPISTDAPATITARKANLKIEKRAGTGDVNGTLNSYTGLVTTIDPLDADIVWNASASRWEVSFDVTGFSGFWLKTQLGVLPLNLISFTGTKTNNGNLLLWKTASEINTKTFEIERQLSVVGSQWSIVGSQLAVGIGANSYQYLDAEKLNETALYRLKMIDNDGRFTYSNIIKLTNKPINQSTIFPNPIATTATLELGDRKLLNTVANIIDANGKIVKSILIKNIFEKLSMGDLPAGIYILRLKNGEVIKLIKE